jgi:hypothetical protein
MNLLLKLGYAESSLERRWEPKARRSQRVGHPGDGKKIF